MMSDYLRLAMIMPFILQRFLKITSLKNNEIIAIKNRLNINYNSVSNYIISYWILVTKIMKVVFSNKFILNEYTLLQKCLKAELEFLLKVINNL